MKSWKVKYRFKPGEKVRLSRVGKRRFPDATWYEAFRTVRSVRHPSRMDHYDQIRLDGDDWGAAPWHGSYWEPMP